MELKYSEEKSVQIILSLLKAHGIKKVVASPGSTNICLVASMQSDPYFEMYSSVDERSAAYIACGMAAESGEAVVLTCTEATASRNYLSGLTEAYYRKLPVLAITATNRRTLVGQNHPQMIDRSSLPKDVAKTSLYLPFLYEERDAVESANLINSAILELFHHGGGPVHIEYETHYSTDYTIKELPKYQFTRRFTIEDKLPKISSGKIAIIIGAHKVWDDNTRTAVESFCEANNAVVLADHISNYKGKYRINPTVVSSQTQYKPHCCEIDLAIYIGDISSSYRKNYQIKRVWRVNPDGMIRNVFGNTSAVFEMSEYLFFKHYSKSSIEHSTAYYELWKEEIKKLKLLTPELPFSNLWIAQQTGHLLPDNSALFLGIENSLRSWNFFSVPDTVYTFCNTGGFGIDGGVSTLIGASLVHPEKLYFGVTGDLAFFYDLNSLGNRHVGHNIRLIVINNGIGQQFKNPGHPAHVLSDRSDDYVAAAGHFGNKSRELLKHYAEDLGFEYLCASTKDEYSKVVERFVTPKVTNKSMILEVFTDTKDETNALQLLFTLKTDAQSAAKGAVKKVLGDKGVKAVKGLFGKKD